MPVDDHIRHQLVLGEHPLRELAGVYLAELRGEEPVAQVSHGQPIGPNARGPARVEVIGDSFVEFEGLFPAVPRNSL